MAPSTVGPFLRSFTFGHVRQLDKVIVRRTRLIGPQAELWPDRRYHALVTDREGDAISLDADRRRHAVIELAIRDLKESAGLNHSPSGRLFANAVWLVLAALAQGLHRARRFSLPNGMTSDTDTARPGLRGVAIPRRFQT